MQRKYDTIKINLTGGVISAGDLMQIISEADKARVDKIQFGSRQQLYIDVPVRLIEQFTTALSKLGISCEINEEKHPNIVSSYVAENVFHNAGWMSEGGYKDILETFNYRPQLKINLVDSGQSFIPFFTGNLNFISSGISNYWFLFLRFPKTNIIYKWPVLLYSLDLCRISKLIEEIIWLRKNEFYDKASIDAELLFKTVNSKEKFFIQSITEDLQLPEFRLPYYEGFNVYSNKTWLGIYRRSESFPLEFIKDICVLCMQTKVGQLYVTPWKTLIIKDIETQYKKSWDYVLGKNRINVRHASNELNWQVEDLCEDGLVLKRYIVSQFDRDDLRTFGLCFAIKTRPKSGLFGSVIIQKCQGKNVNKRMDRYDILYTKNFNPNSKELILFRSRLPKENLPAYLASLCKYYYELQHGTEFTEHDIYQEKVSDELASEPITIELYQCPDCLTVYDESFGDQTSGIEPGLGFFELPENYSCSTCGKAKDEFIAIKKALIQ